MSPSALFMEARARSLASQIAGRTGGRSGPESVKHAAGRAWSAQVRAMTIYARPGWPWPDGEDFADLCLCALELVIRRSDPRDVATATQELAHEVLSGAPTRATLGKLAMLAGVVSLGAGETARGAA